MFGRSCHSEDFKFFINFECSNYLDATYQVFSSILDTVQEEISFEEFHDGHHSGNRVYLNETILTLHGCMDGWMEGRTEDGWMDGWHFFKGLADRQTYMISKVSKIIVYWAVHGRQTQKSTHARTHTYTHRHLHVVGLRLK